MFCENCGAQIPDGMKFCTECGTPVSEREPVEDVRDVFAEAPEAMPAEQKKRSKSAVVVIAALAVVIFVAVLLVKLIMPSGNVRKLVNAAKTTFASGAEFKMTVEFDDGDDEDNTEYKGFLSYDEKGQKINFQYTEDRKGSTYLRTYAYQLDKDEIGYVYVREGKEDDRYGSSGNRVETDIDPKTLFKLVKELKKKDIAKVNYAKLIKDSSDDVYDELEDIIDPKKIGKAINKALKTLEKDESVEITKSGKKYTVKVNSAKAVKAVCKSLDGLVDDDVLDFFEDVADELKDDDNFKKIKVDIELDGKYIKTIKTKIDGADIKVTFSDYGTDKSIKKDYTKLMKESRDEDDE